MTPKQKRQAKGNRGQANATPQREQHPGGPFRPGNQVGVGNRGGPGRPRREVEREYLDAMMGNVSVQDWIAVTDKALEDAKAGDPKAREWLAKYLLPAKSEEGDNEAGRLLIELALMRREIELKSVDR